MATKVAIIMAPGAKTRLEVRNGGNLIVLFGVAVQSKIAVGMVVFEPTGLPGCASPFRRFAGLFNAIPLGRGLLPEDLKSRALYFRELPKESQEQIRFWLEIWARTQGHEDPDFFLRNFFSDLRP